MLDVHPPHEPVHGPRDFFLHLFTITIGLLIALGLEASVEALHHRHQREEAETTIRAEITDNRSKIMDGTAQFKTELAGMKRILESLEAISQGKAAALHEEDFKFHQAPIEDSAWRTASSTGVLSYLGYAEVERFSDAYKEQDQLDTMEKQTLDDYLQLIPILSGHNGQITAEEAKEALPYARHALAHLNGMYFIGEGTIGSYDDALKP